MKAVFSALLAVAVTLLPGLSHAYGPSGDLGFGFVSLIIFVLVLLAIFLLCREIVCWYWKINKAVLLLTEIRDLLQRLQGSSMRTAEGAPPRIPRPTARRAAGMTPTTINSTSCSAPTATSMSNAPEGLWSGRELMIPPGKPADIGRMPMPGAVKERGVDRRCDESSAHVAMADVHSIDCGESHRVVRTGRLIVSCPVLLSWRTRPTNCPRYPLVLSYLRNKVPRYPF